jgi:UDP-N-acetylglucosamine 2-epimerase
LDSMKVLSVVGARPQFVKAAAVSRVLRLTDRESLLHTGQHYDDAMSGVIFRQLGLPEPEIHLGIGSGSHAEQTGTMLIAIEKAIKAEQPDWVLVYGDTNSTLAGALAAAKMGVPVAHVEAGLRSGNRSMPEEHNRIVTDHLADLLLCPTDTAMHQLAREGLASRARLVGDVMVDILRLSLPHASYREWWSGQDDQALDGDYALLTVHRAGNTDDRSRLASIMEAVGEIGLPVVFPVHPRTSKGLANFAISVPSNVRLCEPAPYLAMLDLQRGARVILTDSGGVQKEAYLLGVPCVTLRAETEWPETLEGGWNVLVDVDRERILGAALRAMPETPLGEPFGDGHAAQAVVAALAAWAGSGGR